MSHVIKDVKWYPDVNMLVLTCTECGNVWQHRADRWTTHCGKCGTSENLTNVRKTWPQPLTSDQT